jgi:hypothetical protein
LNPRMVLENKEIMVFIQLMIYCEISNIYAWRGSYCIHVCDQFL